MSKRKGETMPAIARSVVGEGAHVIVKPHEEIVKISRENVKSKHVSALPPLSPRADINSQQKRASGMGHHTPLRRPPQQSSPLLPEMNLSRRVTDPAPSSSSSASHRLHRQYSSPYATSKPFITSSTNIRPTGGCGDTTTTHDVQSSPGRNRTRNRTWSGTSVGENLSIPPLSPPASSSVQRENPLPTEDSSDYHGHQIDPIDESVRRGDSLWSCRRRPHSNGTFSMIVTCNSSILRRRLSALTYFFVMALCFNAVFQKVSNMDEQLSFFQADNNSEKLESHAQNIRQPPEGGKKAAAIEIDMSKPQKTFYAKSNGAAPMYTGGKSPKVNHTRSVAANSTSTGAFFGLVSVIFLTSFVFVRGSHVVHQRWAAVRERMLEQRQMRYGVEDI